MKPTDFMNGLIVKALSGFYYVKSGERIIECKARGKFRSIGKSPLVGDIVDISISGDTGTIDKILDRKNFLERPPIANVNKLFIISSSVTPSPNLLLIDRMIAICEYKNIIPVIIFNKSDLGDLSEFTRKYKDIGYNSFECSATHGIGLDKITSELGSGISVFTGNSGVGKSSLLNCIFPDLDLNTGDVSSKLGRGRHTTRHTELFEHKYNGFVADTPGFSSLEFDINHIEFKDVLDNCFVELAEFNGKCRFSDCKHIGEKDCAVLDAVNKGIIDKDRYNSYKTIYMELKDLVSWNIKKTEER